MNASGNSDPSRSLPAKEKAQAVDASLSAPDETTFHSALPVTKPPSKEDSSNASGASVRYIRLEKHGEGGMGRVWVARDIALDRDVALKELRPEYVENPTALARFLREARITGQLEHPGIVPVYELARFDDDQHPFYTMRLVKGRTLTQACQEYYEAKAAGTKSTSDLPALLHAFVVVCNTVGFAHSRGVIHRDLKGQNVILGDFGEVLVLDWGLAKLMTGQDALDERHDESEPSDSDDAGLTQQGHAMGTPASMAPEQAAGRLEEVDHRTDIYGLGTILYEILTGRPPFVGISTRDVLRQVLEEEPPPPRQLCSDTPLGLESVCLRALAKKPADRYDAAKELAEAVQQWQDAERRQAEKAMRASEEQYRSLADLIPGIVWTARADGWIEYANRFWFQFTGLTLEQTVGSGWAAAVHPDDIQRVAELWTKSLQSGEPIEVDYRIRRFDGTYRWFLAQAKPVRNPDGQIVKWFGMLTEIEDQKQGAKALERQNALVRLLHQVTIAAYEATTVDEALQSVMDLICAYTGWPVGHALAFADDGSAELVSAGIWHLDRTADFQEFVRATTAIRLKAGMGLPGIVLARQEPVWMADTSRDAHFARTEAALGVGIKAAFGFPVLAASGVVAILEFFTTQHCEPNEMLLQAADQIGHQLGQVFSRRRSAPAIES